MKRKHSWVCVGYIHRLIDCFRAGIQANDMESFMALLDLVTLDDYADERRALGRMMEPTKLRQFRGILEQSLDITQSEAENLRMAISEGAPFVIDALTACLPAQK